MTATKPAGDGHAALRRHLPTEEARDLLALVREIARDELAPRAAAAEKERRFRRDVVALLGASGLLGLPYPQEHGAGYVEDFPVERPTADPHPC